MKHNIEVRPTHSPQGAFTRVCVLDITQTPGFLLNGHAMHKTSEKEISMRTIHVYPDVLRLWIVTDAECSRVMWGNIELGTIQDTEIQFQSTVMTTDGEWCDSVSCADADRRIHECIRKLLDAYNAREPALKHR